MPSSTSTKFALSLTGARNRCGTTSKHMTSPTTRFMTEGSAALVVRRAPVPYNPGKTFVPDAGGGNHLNIKNAGCIGPRDTSIEAHRNKYGSSGETRS